jgi:cysteine-rich repeat protein
MNETNGRPWTKLHGTGASLWIAAFCAFVSCNGGEGREPGSEEGGERGGSAGGGWSFDSGGRSSTSGAAGGERAATGGRAAGGTKAEPGTGEGGADRSRPEGGTGAEDQAGSAGEAGGGHGGSGAAPPEPAEAGTGGAEASTPGGENAGGATQSTGGRAGNPQGGHGFGAGSNGAGAEAGVGGGGAICGDGALDPSEACDDAGTKDDDGCSAACAVEYILDSGHVDVFDISYDPSDGLLLQVKDDTSLYDLGSAYRAPEDVIIDVDAALAAIEVPAELPPEFSFLGPQGSVIYVLDQSQQDGLPWPGWNTQGLSGSLPAELLAGLDNGRSVGELEVDITGPGDVFTFTSDVLPDNRFVDTSDGEPDRIPFYLSTHFHTTWVFTALGDYVFKVTPRLFTVSSGTVSGIEREFRFHVGERLVAAEAAPTVSVAGGGAFDLGDPVELTVTVEPEPESPRYQWYHWIGEGTPPIVALTGEQESTLQLVASGPVTEDQYDVALRSSRTGRILALGRGFVTVD